MYTNWHIPLFWNLCMLEFDKKYWFLSWNNELTRKNDVHTQYENIAYCIHQTNTLYKEYRDMAVFNY